jgi:hypothetical protein
MVPNKPSTRQELVGLLKLTMFTTCVTLPCASCRSICKECLLTDAVAVQKHTLMSLHLQGASLHALWQLESALLKRFEVPSFQSLQLPSGCSSLLSVLAAQDELAAALTGYADAWDCGAVPYESVLRVVQQALASMRHGTRGRSRSATTGE